MEEITHFLDFSRKLIKKKIAEFSFSTDDIDLYSYCFRTMENFLQDPDLTESIDLDDKRNMLNNKKFFDHIVNSELIYEDRKKLNRLFINFIKEEVFSLSPKKDKLTMNKPLRLRAYSQDIYDSDKLVNLYSFRFLLKESLKKVLWEVTVFLRELKDVYKKNSSKNPYYEQNIQIIRSICDLLSHFLATSLYELRHNKCKKIIEELELLEKKFYNKLKEHENFAGNPEESIFRGKTISPHFIKILKKGDIFNTNSRLEDIIPKYFGESEKFIDNQEISHHNNGNQLLALKCFDKLKFIFSGFSHIIHYNNIPFELNNYINPENEISYFSYFKPKFENERYFNNMMPSVEFAKSVLDVENYSEEIFFSRGLLYIYYNLRFLNEMETDEKIDSKKKMLENYFGWKPKKWLIKLGRKKSANVKIKCKICVKEISIKFMNKHSEVCMKKKQMCNKLKTIQSNFNKFITVSENIVRYQKTYYRIEKASYKKYQFESNEFHIKLNKIDNNDEHPQKHQASILRSSTVELKNTTNIINPKTCPMKKPDNFAGKPFSKYSINSLDFDSSKDTKEGIAFERIKSDYLFLNTKIINHSNSNNNNEDETLESSFNALDSPDFMGEYIEEKNLPEKNTSVFFKRGDLLLENKPLKIITAKALSDFKDSSNSSDSETKLLASKNANQDEKTIKALERKISKFKPPLKKMIDDPLMSSLEKLEDKEPIQQSFKSQKDFTKDSSMDEETLKILKRKEKKLKETYYLIKLYMIILKTSTLFLKNSIDSKLILKIKETIKELEKYKDRVKSQESSININNYQEYLNEYLETYNILQILIKELDCLENKEFSAISHKSHDKILQNYESDSNSKFLGTPPRRAKIPSSNKLTPPKLENMDFADEEVKMDKPCFENDNNPLNFHEVERTYSCQEKPRYRLALKPQENGPIMKLKSEMTIKIDQTPPHNISEKKTTSEMRTRNKLKRQTITNPYNINQEILSPSNLPSSKKKMDTSSSLSLRRKLCDKNKKTFSSNNIFNIKGLTFNRNESVLPTDNKPLQLSGLNEVLNEEEEFLIDHFLNYHPGYYSDSYLSPKAHVTEIDNSLSIKDFECIRLINKGAFGRVWLVKRKSTNDLYAMKIVNILDHIVNKKDTKFLEAECKIYDVITSEFVVKALFQFTHETFLCFVTEYMIGGDFGYLLNEYKCLDEEVAKFYIAELILAIDSLHAASIIHRDLKPDNILLDANGHIKLTDFGLSKLGIHKKTQEINSPKSSTDDKNINFKLKPPIKFLESEKFPFKKQALNKESGIYEEDDLKTSNSFLKTSKVLTPLRQKISSQNNLSRKHRAIGTPDYIAPEILNGSHNGMNSPSVDWWALGVMIFEFIVGVPPFNEQTPREIFDNILKLAIPWDQIKIGKGEDCMSEEAADLIKKILVLDPDDRITRNGSAELKKHKFFKDIDWNHLRESTAPIIPNKDLENPFDNDHRKMFSEVEKNEPFFNSTKRDSDENLKKAMKKVLQLLPTPKENLGALNETNKQLAKEVNEKIGSESDLINSPLFDEYAKQKHMIKKN